MSRIILASLTIGVFCISAVILGAGWMWLNSSAKGSPFSPVWILVGSMACSACAAYRFVLAERRRLQEELAKNQSIVREHPAFGIFYFHPYSNTWSTTKEFDQGLRVSVGGCGKEPSAVQERTWNAILPMMHSLLATVLLDLQLPPEAKLLTCKPKLIPKRIELGADGSFEIGFDAGTVSEAVALWPTAYFSAQANLLQVVWEP